MDVGLVLVERDADAELEVVCLKGSFQFALEFDCRFPLEDTQYGLLLPRLLLACTGAWGVFDEPRPLNATRRSCARPAL